MTTFQRAPDALWRRSFGRLIARSRNGAVVVVDGNGAALWDALAEPGSVTELGARLASAFDVDPTAAAHDIEPVLDLLVARGLARTDP